MKDLFPQIIFFFVSFSLPQIFLSSYTSPRTQPAETSERAERLSRRGKHNRDTATADRRDAEEEKERKREDKDRGDTDTTTTTSEDERATWCLQTEYSFA